MGLNPHIIDLSQVYKVDEDLVGKKAFELGELKYLGIPIPDGFIIKTSFFEKFMETTGISKDLEKMKKTYHPSLKDSVGKLFEPVRKKIMHTHIPQKLAAEIQDHYKKLSDLFKESSLNIVTSPLKGKSLHFSDIKGDANLILKIKEIWALQIHNPAAIIIQKNITSKTKGTIVTSNPPKELEHIARKIQKHFYFPKVLDYVIEKGKIYITQMKPFTGEFEMPSLTWQNKKTQNVLIKGISINPGIVTGCVKILGNNSHVKIKNGDIIIIPHVNKSLFGKIKKARALVADSISLNPYDRMLYQKNIKIPTIIGTGNASKILQNGNIVTVNGISGEIYSGGLIY